MALLRQRHPDAFDGLEPVLGAKERHVAGCPAHVDVTVTRVAEVSLIVVFGFGDGTLVGDALEEAPRDARVVVCVLDPVRFGVAMGARDLSGILVDPRVELLAGSLEKITSRMPRPEEDVLEVLVTPGLHEAADPGLERLVDMAEELERRRWSDRLHRPAVLDNIERNLDVVLAAPGVSSLADGLSGRAVLVLAPGPSLSDLEQALRGRVLPLVVALDTTLRSLREWDVRVDLAITVDPSLHNLGKFRDVPLDMPLVFFESARPEVVLRARTPVYACEENSLLDRAHPWFGSRGHVRAGGSVLYAAVDMLVRLGTRQVALAGADLAVDASGHHVEGALTVAREPVSRQVLSRGGGMVGTTETLWRHARRLRRLAGRQPAGRVIDVTTRGAALDPLPRTTLEKWLDSLPPEDFSTTIAPEPSGERAPPEARTAALDALSRAHRKHHREAK